MKTEKEIWVNEALQSVEGLQPARPQTDLAQLAWNRIQQVSRPLPFAWTLAIAASFALLVTFNWVALNQTQERSLAQAQQMDAEAGYSPASLTYRY